MRRWVPMLGAAVCVVCHCWHAQASPTVTIVERCEREVLAPVRVLRLDLGSALSAGDLDPTTGKPQLAAAVVARADGIDEKAWQVVLAAREHWFTSEARSAFEAYVSAVEGLLAADFLCMVPRTGERLCLTRAVAHLEAGEAAAKQARQSAEFERATPAAPARVVEPAPGPQSDASSYTVYITESGAKYHRAGCHHLSQSAIPITRAEAEAQGYTPCKTCKP